MCCNFWSKSLIYGWSFFASLRLYLGTYLFHKHSPVFSGLCSVRDGNKVSLKQGHQPLHDTPEKPTKKEWSGVLPASKPVRWYIALLFSCKNTAKSHAQRVRFCHYVCFFSIYLFSVHYHLGNDGVIYFFKVAEVVWKTP